MGQLTNNRLIINELGNVFLVKSGSTTTGVSQSISIPTIFNVSMSSNIGNRHTPTDQTGSYLTISCSNAAISQSYNVYWYNTGSVASYNIKMAPNSSSAGGGYGSLGGSYFAVSQSNKASYFYYANPETRLRATSSLIDIVGLHSSSNANTDSQYAFFISGSDGTVYKLCATSSLLENDYSSYSSSPVIIPFEYHAVSMSLEEATGSGGIVAINGPEPISDGIARMVFAINENKSTIGASVTASFSSSVITGITFNAVSDDVGSRMSFFTQSLQSGSSVALKEFVFSGATHISSSQPNVSSNDRVFAIPVAFTSSEYNVMTSSHTVMTSASGFPAYNDLSASLSGSEDSPGALVFQNRIKKQHVNISGSMNPIFEFRMTHSGSGISLPSNPGNGATNFGITVGEFDTPTLVQETVTQINNYMFYGANEPPSRVRGYPYLSASLTSNSTFTLTTPPVAIGEDPIDYTYAPQITGSILQSGSGTEIGGNFIEGDAPSGSTDVLMSFQFDPADRDSAVVSGSGIQMLYMSSSGNRLGINTTTPISDIDLRADEFQIQSNAQRRGIRINDEGNIESFSNDANQAATGSEFILSYSRGISIDNNSLGTEIMQEAGGFAADEIADNGGAGDLFELLDPRHQTEILATAEKMGFLNNAAAGDVLGSIRWVAESGSTAFGKEADEAVDTRGSGEAAVIQAVVDSAEDAGITADLLFKLPRLVTDKPSTVLRLDHGLAHELTGSLTLSSGISTPSTITAISLLGKTNSNTKIDLNQSSGNTIELLANGVTTIQLVNNAVRINPDGANYLDFYVEGDSDQNLIASDAATDRVGIGTSAPQAKLHVAGDISSSGTITTVSASISKLEVSDTNIIGQRHILFNSGIYINDNPLLVDNGYFGSSISNTPSNWNDPTPSSFDSSAGTFEQVIDITEDEHGSKVFFAPFAVSRIEVLSSWRVAGTGDDELFWCGIWTGSAGERLGASSGAHSTVKNIGHVTGSIQTFDNGGNWEGHNLDLDFTFTTPLPEFTQIYYGFGSGETSSVGSKNVRGHITMMVYEA